MMALLNKLFGGAKQETQKAVIMGLDGVPYTLIKKLTENGTMPRLADIFRQGSLRKMATSLPEVSSVAWTSFMTGVNPAKHGIYGFMDLRPKSYDMFFPDYKFVKAKTLWEFLGDQGKRSIVLNLPGTYPAREFNGVMVSGFVAIDLKKATYPQTYDPMLESMGYRLDVDANKARESMDAFVDDVYKTLKAREEALLHFFDKEAWDLFVGVISETDRIHHFLFAAFEDEKHPYHAFFIDVYKKIDEILGKVYDRMAPGTPFFMLSDHGFTVIRHEVYLNRWLMEEGYLKFSKEPPDSYTQIAEGTRAFNMDPARIYIHLKGKYPRGTVSPGAEYEALRDEIREKLLKFPMEGSPVVDRVYKKEEIFEGAEFDVGPDLVAVPKYGFDLKGAISRPSVTGRSIFTGMHTQDDAHFFVNRPGAAEGVNILDVIPTVLQAMGEPRRDWLEGKGLLPG
ncbi:MAG: alkaline phosphatase family protein [Nitrospirae bacterium]|nr:alkaline phosphatase family protein [Nitrospirota bacterium]